ncbi:MAG: hypothetical protein RIS51_493 [Actinomycetota bacterium]|jgi:uncharacterized membrane protein YfcA
MAVLVLVSLVGFFAQLIDGAMGMAFGITSTTFLLMLSYSPASASMAVHLAELATSAISGISHIRYGNVNWPAFSKVALPGSIGAFLGAFALSTVDLSSARPWTATVLLSLGFVVIYRFTRREILGKKRRARARWLVPLGFAGGFIDATGGGGWGPTVTTTLTASNALSPRVAIGTTNAAEFFIAISASAGFLLGLPQGAIPISVAVALLLGGVLAAPLAAWLVRKAPQRYLGLAVGNLIIFLNTYQLSQTVITDPLIQFLIFGACCGVLYWSISLGYRLHKSLRK